MADNRTQKQEAQRLKAIYEAKRFGLNLTHESIAKVMKVNQGSISHFLNGRNPLPIERAIQFADLLQCEVSDFSERLAQQAANFGIAVSTASVFIDVVLVDLNMNDKEMIKLIETGAIFDDLDSQELIFWPRKHSTKTFALNVKGKEAQPLIDQGSLAFIDSEVEPEINDIVLLSENKEKLLFAEVIGNGHLQFPNAEYPDRIFKMTSKLKILGKVIGHQAYH